MILRSALLAFEDEHAQEHDAEQRNPLFPQTSCSTQTSSSNPAAGQGKVPETDERMDAIRNMKTMAGSPDADFLLDQRPAVLRMVFVFGAAVLS